MPPSNPFGFAAVGEAGYAIDGRIRRNRISVSFSSWRVRIVSRRPSRMGGWCMGTNDASRCAGLLTATPYFYTIFAVDSSGNRSNGASADTRTRVGTSSPPQAEPSEPRVSRPNPLLFLLSPPSFSIFVRFILRVSSSSAISPTRSDGSSSSISSPTSSSPFLFITSSPASSSSSARLFRPLLMP